MAVVRTLPHGEAAQRAGDCVAPRAPPQERSSLLRARNLGETLKVSARNLPGVKILAAQRGFTMASDQQGTYEFGQFTLVPTEKRLLCDREVVPLAPKVFDTLVLLVENQGRLVQKDELLKALWPETVVEEQALAHNISQLRKVLRDPAEDPKFIETVPKRGYRFIASVRAVTEPAPVLTSPAPSSAAPSAMQRVRWPRRTVLAVLAALLVLAAGATAYIYFPRTGPKAARALPAIHSLAVLPLESLSGDKEQEYFADGMTDALITDLAQIGSLRVISRTSAMQFKGSRKTLPQIGRDLNVDAVVEGTVTRGERRVRVTAQLIQASSDQHLWARTYERDLQDILALQDEIARDITVQIRVTLTPGEHSRLTQAQPVDPEAYDSYLRGRYWWSKEGGEWKGLDYFQKAIAKDPGYAPAYSGVADSFLNLGDVLSPREVYPKAKEAAIKALELDPFLAEAHASLAAAKFVNDWDWPGAVDEIKQAIAFSPNYGVAHWRYSHYLAAVGRLDEAIGEIERARELDPFSHRINVALGTLLYWARRHDDALRQYQRCLEMFPDDFGVYNAIADVYERKKMFAEAFAARQQALVMQKDPTVGTLADAYQRSGYRGWVLKKVQILEQAPPQTMQTGERESLLEPYKNFGMAYFSALLNDEAHAMDYLERAIDGRNPEVLFLQVDPAWDPIRSSPRFRDLVRRVGLPESVNRQEAN
jgi:TolB-like protein/DNA-binding winged helix-turn-helix (wHTH) protein/Tfp pilus assembly protein PilF